MSAITGFQVAGTTFVDLLNQWASFGIFSHFLPFLLIFAIVFGILSKSKILGDNKGVNVVISVAIGLLALQYDLVPRFFSQIIPLLGSGIIVLLVILILSGLFIDWDQKGTNWIFFVIGGIIALIVIGSAFFTGGSINLSIWWQQYGGMIILFLLIIGAVVAVALSGPKASS